MPPLIAGNWKMNKLHAEALDLARAVRDGAGGIGAELLVCPPFLALAAVAEILRDSPVALGGQDCHMAPSGAHTGDISAPMLKDAGAGWVILGHSERRQNHGELDETVREKVLAATAAGLTPIVCLGETDDQRSAGQETDTVGWQIEGSLPKSFAGVIAYEPVWAIGTGRIPELSEIATMHAFIREELLRQFGEAGRAVRILYGGSVKPSNAAAILSLPEVGGALIGGASLSAGDFLAIAGAAPPA